MIKYYGTPLTPKATFIKAMTGRNVLIPYPRPADMKRAEDVSNGIIIDNGAFTIWNKGGSIDWDKFYEWIKPFIDRIDFFFIPDVIDGTEIENDRLIAEYRYREYQDPQLNKGIPIWHLNESTERLSRLMNSFEYIALGSAAEYRTLGTKEWHTKMDEAMRVLCDDEGIPKVKIHMLRCLDPKIFTQYPFYSGDSTSLAQNHKRDGWKAIVDRIEKYDSPKKYTFKKYYKQKNLFT